MDLCEPERMGCDKADVWPGQLMARDDSGRWVN